MWTLYRKELMELLRDRKTLFFAIAMPLLIFPLLFGVVGYVTANQLKKAQSEELTIALSRPVAEVVQAIEGADNLRLVEGLDLDDIRAVIKSEQADVVIVIPDDHGEKTRQMQQSQWQVHYDAASINKVMDRVTDALSGMTDGLKTDYAQRLGIDAERRTALLEPVLLEKVSVADQRESVGQALGGFLPYLLFFTCLMGAMFPAIDLGAGEKERGTLETLLLSPVPRMQLVLGKFMVVFTSAVVAALLSVASLTIWGLIIGQYLALEKILSVIASVGLGDMLLVMVMLVPIAAIFSAAMLSLSIYARSFKEAQNYMNLLTLPMIMPIMLAMLPGVELNAQWALVPITNVALAIKEILKGTVDYTMLGLILGSSLVLAGALISFCIYWFRQEKVLFR